jgi:membrane protein insertase Oxa1/YidC/SpoIIIJ
LTVPAGLTLYSLVNALATIVQQVILNKKLEAEVL